MDAERSDQPHACAHDQLSALCSCSEHSPHGALFPRKAVRSKTQGQAHPAVSASEAGRMDIKVGHDKMGLEPDPWIRSPTGMQAYAVTTDL